MKNTNLLVLFVLGMIVMSSCKKDTYRTSHPDFGKIEFIADWSNIEEGLSTPKKYTLYVDDRQASTIPTSEKVFPILIKPGIHSILVYSNSEKVIVEPDLSLAKAQVVQGFINGNLGWLFTMSDIVQIERDIVHEVRGEMEQQLRKLVLILNIKKDVSVSDVNVVDESAVLTGVAAEWNYESEVALSEAKVRPEFKVYNKNEFRASMELLGVVPESINRQILSFGLIYNDKRGEKKEVKIDIDLTGFMKSFNENRNIPLILKCNVLGINGEIAKWEMVEEDSQIVLWPD